MKMSNVGLEPRPKGSLGKMGNWKRRLQFDWNFTIHKDRMLHIPAPKWQTKTSYCPACHGKTRSSNRHEEVNRRRMDEDRHISWSPSSAIRIDECSIYSTSWEGEWIHSQVWAENPSRIQWQAQRCQRKRRPLGKTSTTGGWNIPEASSRAGSTYAPLCFLTQLDWLSDLTYRCTRQYKQENLHRHYYEHYLPAFAKLG